MVYQLRFAVLPVCLIASSACAGEAEPSVNATTVETFERRIRPLLSEHCYPCHSLKAKKQHGGLQLDTAQSLKRGGDSGAVLVPGNPEKSLLIAVVRHEGDVHMPPKGKLSDRELDALTEWVKRGAFFPDSGAQEPSTSGSIDYIEGRQFWSFQPVQQQALPALADHAWSKQRMDDFVLAGMHRNGLSPSPAANRATLIRRLSFAMTGLPPKPDEVRRFTEDDSADAYSRLVDSLLESPRYGEKWGRWWLDMARYTDRTASWLHQSGQPYLYRDWVVRALNDDMSYDEFIHRQLATDLIPETGPDDLPALGFIGLSPTYWKELKLPCEIINVIVADEWEERVDAVSRTFLGLTVACARCHDHKFDPISSEDYYALAGVFASSRQVELPTVPAESYAPVLAAKQKVAELEAELAKRKKETPVPQQRIDEISQTVNQIKTTTPLYNLPLATALSEESMFVVRAGKTPQDGTRLEYRKEPRDLPLFARGNPNRPGPIVQRRFLAVLSAEPKPYRNGSGRLELAQSITTEAAPLTARVLVNRIWLAHFGRGLVTTPSDFGRQGSPPSHPELLDDLAARFIANGWSIKKLHREILTSATWQQASAETSNHQRDPENQWFSYMIPRRLDLEEWRDAMLDASETLDAALGGASIDIDSVQNRRRTLYATVHRRDMSPTFMVHDFPDPTQHSSQRTLTITAIQGLFALNSPLLADQAKTLAKRQTDRTLAAMRAGIIDIHWRLFSRPPTEREIELGQQFVGDESQSMQATWQQYAHVLLASNEFLFID
jgi:hypothetical protein